MAGVTTHPLGRRLVAIARAIRRRVLVRSARIERLYARMDYLDAYRRHTDLAVKADPRFAAGGLWDTLGQLQIDFLVGHGLEPNHKLLDIGCGTLRAGRHFIRYLDEGNYVGFDLSAEAIKYGERLVAAEGLSGRRPRLLVNEGKDLRFGKLAGETFDFVLAHSVFAHLKPEHIRECFANIGRVMGHGSVFFFTYWPGTTHSQIGLKHFCYPLTFFESLAAQHGFTVQDHSSEYSHPKGQRMVAMRAA